MTVAVENMPRYERYKDSGIDWIGEIPAHWELLSLGSRFKERRTKVSDKDFAPLSVTKKGVVPQLESAAKTNDGDNRKLVKKGDFVINSRSDRKGSSGIAFQNGSVSLINTVLYPKEIHPVYCNYLLKSNGFVEEFYRMGHGIVADLWTTRYDEMSSIILGIPTIEEQQAIATFLDEKTAQIDQAIKIKEQQITLLKERKQIIIQNAVTKGLDPNVPMKDSGVEWIGEIPAHWECSAVKRFLAMPITDGPHTTPELVVTGFPFISAEAIKDGQIDFNKKRGYINKKDHNNFCKKYRPKKGDVYMVKSGATTGNVAIIETNQEFSIWSPLAVFRSNDDVLSNLYLYMTLQSSYFFKGVELNWSFGTQQNIGMGILGNLPITVPPKKEQTKIAAYIKDSLGQVDNAINLHQTQINNLNEYKATLINSTVTGKIKVI